MATTLSGQITANLNFAYAYPVTGFANSLNIQDTDQKSVQYTTGTATANAANRIYQAIVSLAGGANTTLDLETLTDQLNLSLDFVRVKAVQVHLLSTTDNSDIGTNATSIVFGNAASNQALQGNATYGIMGEANGTLRVFNGGFISFANPAAAGLTIDSTHSDLRFENEDPSVTAKVLLTIIGADA